MPIDEPWPGQQLPPLIFLECDYGADWPTWVPNHEPPYRGQARTNYFSLDGVSLPEELSEDLKQWQRWWECLDPDEPEGQVDEAEWSRFVDHGRELAERLSLALGAGVKVELRWS